MVVGPFLVLDLASLSVEVVPVHCLVLELLVGGDDDGLGLLLGHCLLPWHHLGLHGVEVVVHTAFCLDIMSIGKSSWIYL